VINQNVQIKMLKTLSLVRMMAKL